LRVPSKWFPVGGDIGFPGGYNPAMGSTFHSVRIHVIFTCKERRPLLTPEMQKRIHPYIGGICRKHRNILLEGGGVADHIHLLIGLSMTQAVADLLREIKAGTSKWIHETWPGQEFAWQEGYGAFSVSVSLVKKTREYIRNQEQHHKTQTLQQELQQFAELHGMRMTDDGSFELVEPPEEMPHDDDGDEPAE
jgi:REP element-mobilizing transposase RayT